MLVTFQAPECFTGYAEYECDFAYTKPRSEEVVGLVATNKEPASKRAGSGFIFMAPYQSAGLHGLPGHIP